MVPWIQAWPRPQRCIVPKLLWLLLCCPPASLPRPASLVVLLQEVAFRAREEALKRRDLELQESLLRFTRFLQENDAKRAKAQRRAADEERLRGEREAEIARLHGEAEACRAQREAMQAQLAKVARWAHWGGTAWCVCVQAEARVRHGCLWTCRIHHEL